MFRLDGRHVGDPWFHIEDGRAHMWFLTQPTSLPREERGWHWDVGYATSADLESWEYRGIVLERGWGDAWDSQKLATGSVIERDGRYWMAYTGHRARWLGVQRAGMAWSDDLATWHKLDENPTTEAARPWYDLGVRTEDKAHCSWRDPFLIDDGEWMYQLVCAVSAQGDRDTAGVVGRARSRDMRNWEVVSPLDAERVARRMECPNMHHIDDRWYLVYSSHPGMVSDMMRARFPDREFGPAAYSMVGEDMWGPYRLHGLGAIQPDDAPVRIYAPQLVRWKGAWFAMGFLLDPETTYGEAIANPVRVRATAEGIKEVVGA